MHWHTALQATCPRGGGGQGTEGLTSATPVGGAPVQVEATAVVLQGQVVVGRAVANDNAVCSPRATAQPALSLHSKQQHTASPGSAAAKHAHSPIPRRCRRTCVVCPNAHGAASRTGVLRAVPERGGVLHGQRRSTSTVIKLCALETRPGTRSLHANWDPGSPYRSSEGRPTTCTVTEVGRGGDGMIDTSPAA